MIITERLRLTQLIKGWEKCEELLRGSPERERKREPAGPLNAIDIFLKIFFSGTLQFSRIRVSWFWHQIYHCYCHLLFVFFFFLRRGDLQDLSSVCGFWGILSICTIIAFVHPSRCLREKREKRVWEPEIAMYDFTFSHFLFRAFKKSTYTKGLWIYIYIHT